MMNNIKLYLGGFILAVIAGLAAAVKIQSSRLESTRKKLANERNQKEAAQEAVKAIQQSKKVIEDAMAIKEEVAGMSDADARSELRKYATD